LKWAAFAALIFSSLNTPPAIVPRSRLFVGIRGLHYEIVTIAFGAALTPDGLTVSLKPAPPRTASTV
jgi:hypothetical protein